MRTSQTTAVQKGSLADRGIRWTTSNRRLERKDALGTLAAQGTVSSKFRVCCLLSNEVIIALLQIVPDWIQSN